MFSPALISMILHESWREADFRGEEQIDLTPGTLVEHLARLQGSRTVALPIVAQTADPSLFGSWLNGASEEASDAGHPTQPRWGWVPLKELIAALPRRMEIGADFEFIDLGTPLQPSAAISATDLVDRCDQILSSNPRHLHSPDVCVAFIDQGIVDPAAPTMRDTFGGQLTQLVPGAQMSDHAIEVFSVLLERLSYHGGLARVDLACALVKEQSPSLGSKVFDHANAIDLLDAINALDSYLANIHLPAVTNISYGTHVGPHNGQSPLEDAVTRRLTTAPNRWPERFAFAAAGNFGNAAVYGLATPSAGDDDDVHLTTGAYRAKTLLVELWWQEPTTGSNLVIDVTVANASGAQISNLCGGINAGHQTLLVMPSASYFRSASLYSSRCHGSMSCAAYAVSVDDPHDLRNLQITFSLKTTSALSVNCWTVLNDDRNNAVFIGAGRGGSIVVPSTAPNMICVTGVNEHGQLCSVSSRGPACTYDATLPPGTADTSPALAHLASLSPTPSTAGTTKYFTSYASPRACADAANVLVNQAPHTISGRDALVNMLLGSARLPAWSPKYGWGRLPL